MAETRMKYYDTVYYYTQSVDDCEMLRGPVPFQHLIQTLFSLIAFHLLILFDIMLLFRSFRIHIIMISNKLHDPFH